MNKRIIKKSIMERISSGVDSLVGVFSPASALKRRFARYTMQATFRGGGGGYAGARHDRLRESWVPRGGSADQDLLPDLATLRERSRDLARNDALAAGAIQTMGSNVVGTGIRPQSRVDKRSLDISDEEAEAFQYAAERVWQRWEPAADAAQRMSFWEMQALVERQMLLNGEIVVIPEMIDAPGRPYYLALNIVESDRLATPADRRGDKTIREGVELGPRGEPVAYWICKSHPGDTRYGRHIPDSKNFIRYPVRNKYGRLNVLHLYWVKRPGQTRGEPFFAPVLNAFKDLADYSEAELVAQRVAACIALIVKTSNAFEMATNANSKTQGNQRINEMEPGMVKYLNQGEDIVDFNPARPNAQIDAFMLRSIRKIGTGLNMPYELIFKDFSKTNYSSARAAFLEVRKFFRSEQEWMGKKFCQPVWEMLMDEAFLRDELPAEGFFDGRRHDDWLRAKWIAPGWGYIDPAKEIAAAQEAIKSNLSTYADECAALGRDYEEVFDQAAREKEALRKRGLKDIETPSTPSPGKQPEEKDEEDEEDEDE